MATDKNVEEVKVIIAGTESAFAYFFIEVGKQFSVNKMVGIKHPSPQKRFGVFSPPI